MTRTPDGPASSGRSPTTRSRSLKWYRRISPPITGGPWAAWVNTVTKSGQNAIHGSPFCFLRSTGFDAHDPCSAFTRNLPPKTFQISSLWRAAHGSLNGLSGAWSSEISDLIASGGSVIACITVLACNTEAASKPTQQEDIGHVCVVQGAEIANLTRLA